MGSLSPFPGDLPNPWIEPRSPALQADSLPAEPPGKPRNIRRRAQSNTHPQAHLPGQPQLARLSWLPLRHREQHEVTTPGDSGPGPQGVLPRTGSQHGNDVIMTSEPRPRLPPEAPPTSKGADLRCRPSSPEPPTCSGSASPQNRAGRKSGESTAAGVDGEEPLRTQTEFSVAKRTSLSWVRRTCLN